MLHARLVERIYSQQITADTTSLFEEIEQTTNVVFAQFRKYDAHIRYATVYVSQLRSQFGHLVHFVHTLAG